MVTQEQTKQQNGESKMITTKQWIVGMTLMVGTSILISVIVMSSMYGKDTKLVVDKQVVDKQVVDKQVTGIQSIDFDPSLDGDLVYARKGVADTIKNKSNEEVVKVATGILDLFFKNFNDKNRDQRLASLMSIRYVLADIDDNILIYPYQILLSRARELNVVSVVKSDLEPRKEFVQWRDKVDNYIGHHKLKALVEQSMDIVVNGFGGGGDKELLQFIKYAFANVDVNLICKKHRDLIILARKN